MQSNSKNRIVSTKTPKLILIGAGPGDPDLITLKAIKILKQAKVVLYDALINEDILVYAKQAEKIFVGKRKGCYAYSQEQINELIVQRAYSTGEVVRLKGGDPYVFGRGAEEAEYAASKGVSIEYVPGITSAIGVLGRNAIPVTKRGYSESFWVITGTTKNHGLSDDIYDAAKSNATVIILMGMSKLLQIIEIFQRENKGDLSVAIIQNGTTNNEKMVMGTVDCIANKVKKEQIANPAVIVIGNVVKHKQRMELLNQLNLLQLENV